RPASTDPASRGPEGGARTASGCRAEGPREALKAISGVSAARSQGQGQDGGLAAARRLGHRPPTALPRAPAKLARVVRSPRSLAASNALVSPLATIPQTTGRRGSAQAAVPADLKTADQ